MKSTMTVWPGRPHPLGATWDGEGVNFALFSQHAEQVVLCLFDAKGKQEMAQIHQAGRGALLELLVLLFDFVECFHIALFIRLSACSLLLCSRKLLVDAQQILADVANLRIA